mmetsp:Transcript_4472/g.13239  ORF Transcript_4472/g.13239 Transcript_4472/m.13239 type:complete len:450 (-) Transcript_4472:2042-3391(-)
MLPHADILELDDGVQVSADKPKHHDRAQYVSLASAVGRKDLGGFLLQAVGRPLGWAEALRARHLGGGRKAEGCKTQGSQGILVKGRGVIRRSSEEEGNRRFSVSQDKVLEDPPLPLGRVQRPRIRLVPVYALCCLCLLLGCVPQAPDPSIVALHDIVQSICKLGPEIKLFRGPAKVARKELHAIQGTQGSRGEAGAVMVYQSADAILSTCQLGKTLSIRFVRLLHLHIGQFKTLRHASELAGVLLVQKRASPRFCEWQGFLHVHRQPIRHLRIEQDVLYGYLAGQPRLIRINKDAIPRACYILPAKAIFRPNDVQNLGPRRVALHPHDLKRHVVHVNPVEHVLGRQDQKVAGNQARIRNNLSHGALPVCQLVDTELVFGLAPHLHLPGACSDNQVLLIAGEGRNKFPRRRVNHGKVRLDVPQLLGLARDLNGTKASVRKGKEKDLLPLV